jgi:hypothetical protein
MSDRSIRRLSACGLVIGALFGMLGSFAPSSELRGLAWGIDGVAIIVGSSLLAVHHLRRGDGQLAAGFLVFLVGEALITSAAAMDLAASRPALAAGAGVWAAGLALISVSTAMPLLVRSVGAIAAILLAISSARLFYGASLTPLSQPLPFLAYPFLALTLFGWAWSTMRHDRHPERA